MSVVPEHVVTLSLPAEVPALRLLAVPACEPPYDDELAAQTRAAGAAPGPGRPLRRLVPLRLVDDDEAAQLPAAAAVDPAGLPSVRPIARALVQGLLEVLAGVRPVSQLRRITSAELYDQLEAQVQGQPQATGRRPGTGAVRSLHVQERGAVAEVCARVDRHGRAAALALRLEASDGSWRCTEVAGV